MYRKLYRMVFVFGIILLAGCGETEQVGDTQTEGTEQIKENDNETAMTFPKQYKDEIEKVAFDMEIIIDTDIQENALVTAKANLQKADWQKAFDFLYGDVKDYETYEYVEKNEYGEETKMGIYMNPDGLNFSYGSYSSHISYTNAEITPYIYASFVLDKTDSAYNADLYSCETQLSFKSREDAFALVEQALTEMGIQMDMEYHGYALDYQTMQEQEWHMGMDGEQDDESYKPDWSEADDCYYFAINQMYRGLPMYHPFSGVFTKADDSTAPVMALVSNDGIQHMDVERVFEMTEEQEGVQLCSIENIAAVIANKYNQILGDSQYEILKARLYYYVDINSGLGTYDVKPVWIITGLEKAQETEQAIQIIIDAQTAEEIYLDELF